MGDAKLSEIERIAFKPDFTYMITDFLKLFSIQSKLVAALNFKKTSHESVSL